MIVWKVSFIPQLALWRYLLCTCIVLVYKMFLNEMFEYILYHLLYFI